MMKRWGMMKAMITINKKCTVHSVADFYIAMTAWANHDIPSEKVFQKFSGSHSFNRAFRIFNFEERMDQPEVFLFHTPGKKSCCPYPHKACWQDMHQETANKFMRLQAHLLYCVAVMVIDFIFETDCVSTISDDAAVRYRCAVCISAEIGGEGSFVSTPISSIACASNIHIGKNVFINGGCLFMARGGITIEDDAQIAANVEFISNNHDPYERMVLLYKPVLIRQGAWIGAGAAILPGVSVGRYAIVGAGSVVTKDVGDYEVVVGNPARLVKTLDAERFGGGK